MHYKKDRGNIRIARKQERWVRKRCDMNLKHGGKYYSILPLFVALLIGPPPNGSPLPVLELAKLALFGAVGPSSSWLTLRRGYEEAGKARKALQCIIQS